VALCRCGASANKPFCDGSHRRVGFRTGWVTWPRPPGCRPAGRPGWWMTPQSRGFVTKVASSSDARGAWPGLPPGHGQAEVRWTVHLASVRNRFFDHIDVTAV